MPLKSKTYAEPEKKPLSPSPIAPTIVVLPDIDTELPNQSLPAPSDAVIFVSGRANTFSTGYEMLRIKILVTTSVIVNLLFFMSLTPKKRRKSSY